MSELQRARMQQKRDTTENWEQDSGKNFIPKPGELIIINDNLEKQAEGEGARSLVKIGDGVTSVGELQAITGEVYVQSGEPKKAGEGAVWIDPEDEPLNDEIIKEVDWNKQQGQVGYIKNKPFNLTTSSILLESQNFEENWYQKINENWYDFKNVSNIALQLENFDSYKVFEQYCDSFYQVLALAQENLAEGETGIFFLNGASYYYSTTSTVIILMTFQEDLRLELLGLINDSQVDVNGEVLGPGTYFFRLDNNTYIKNFSFDYTEIKYENEYKEIFKKTNAANVYVIDLSAFLEQGLSENLVSLLISELGKYQPGEILLVPTALLGLLG